MFSLFHKKPLPFDPSSFDDIILIAPLLTIAIKESENLLYLIPKVSNEQELKIRLECIIATFSIILYFYNNITKTEDSGLIASYYATLSEKTLLPQLKKEIDLENSWYPNYSGSRIDYYKSEIGKLLGDDKYIPLAMSITLILKPLRFVPYTCTTEYDEYLKAGNYELAFQLKVMLSKVIPFIYVQLNNYRK